MFTVSPFTLRAALRTATFAAACALAGCAGRPPALSQVSSDAAEQPINTPAQAADLKERRTK